MLNGCYLVNENDRIVEAWLPDPSPDDYPRDAVHQHSAYTSDITWDIWIRRLDPGPDGLALLGDSDTADPT